MNTKTCILVAFLAVSTFTLFVNAGPGEDGK